MKSFKRRRLLVRFSKVDLQKKDVSEEKKDVSEEKKGLFLASTNCTQETVVLTPGSLWMIALTNRNRPSARRRKRNIAIHSKKMHHKFKNYLPLL